MLHNVWQILHFFLNQQTHNIYLYLYLYLTIYHYLSCLLNEYLLCNSLQTNDDIEKKQTFSCIVWRESNSTLSNDNATFEILFSFPCIVRSIWKRQKYRILYKQINIPNSHLIYILPRHVCID